MECILSVGTVSGYTSSPSSGTVKVTGGPASESVTFSKTNQTTGFLGLPGYDGYIIVGVILAVAAVGAILLMRGKSNGASGIDKKDPKDTGIAEGAAQQVAVE